MRCTTAIKTATVAIAFVSTFVSPATAQMKKSGGDFKLGYSKGNVQSVSKTALQIATLVPAVVAGRNATSHFQDALDVKEAPYTAKSCSTPTSAAAPS